MLGNDITFAAKYPKAWQLISKSDQGAFQIKTFAAESQEVGEKHYYSPLKIWGELLNTQASQFQLDKLPKTLGQFSELIEQIRLLISKKVT